MNWGELITALSGSVVISGIVAAVVTNWLSGRLLQSHKAQLDKELETHKSTLGKESDRQRLLLKWQEMKFERQLLAAEALTQFCHKALDQSAGPDNDDVDQYYEGIAARFGDFEVKLTDLIGKYDVAWGAEAKTMVIKARDVAKLGKYSYGHDYSDDKYHPDRNLSDQTTKHAQMFSETLKAVINQVQQDVKNGSFE